MFCITSIAIKLLFTASVHWLVINGKLVASIHFTRGVMQGDPIVGILFVWALHPLLVPSLRGRPPPTRLHVPGSAAPRRTGRKKERRLAAALVGTGWIRERRAAGDVLTRVLWQPMQPNTTGPACGHGSYSYRTAAIAGHELAINYRTVVFVPIQVSRDSRCR